MEQPPVDLSIQLAPRISVEVVIAGFGAALLAFVVCGVIPAWYLTRRDVSGSLRDELHGGTTPKWGKRRLLIAGQVAVSSLLIAVAALATQQVAALSTHDYGIELDRLAMLQLDFSFQPGNEVVRQVLNRVRQVPSIQFAAVASGLPFGTSSRIGQVSGVGPLSRVLSSEPRRVQVISATPGIFSTLHLPVRLGREIADTDSATGELVAIVSAWTAQMLFGTDDVLGRQLRLKLVRNGRDTPQPEIRTIVGVTADTDAGGVGRRSEAVVFLPFDQHYVSRVFLIARTDTPVASLSLLSETVASIAPDLRVVDSGSGTGPAIAGTTNLPLRIIAMLTGILGATSLFLAMTGLYGIINYLVVQRSSEIAVRRALGASRGAIYQLVFRDGLRPVLYGLASGAGLAVLCRVAWRTLYGSRVTSQDPLVFIGVIFASFLIAAFACYWPARMAAQIDPIVLLKRH